MKGELIAFIEGWAGEREVESFNERSKRNKYRLAQKGLFAHGDCGGVYGYDYNPATKGRTVNEEEAERVLEIYDRVEDMESLHSIACDFNDRGIPTKHGAKWERITVKNIVRRTSYFGLDFYGRTRVVNGVRTPVPREEWVEIFDHSPPIMSGERHERVNRAYDNRTERVRSQKFYLLTGFIVCSLCGGRVSGRSNATKEYYRCGRTASSPG